MGVIRSTGPDSGYERRFRVAPLSKTYRVFCAAQAPSGTHLLLCYDMQSKGESQMPRMDREIDEWARRSGNERSAPAMIAGDIQE